VKGMGAQDEIRVLINSPGGSVYEGLAIYHELATNPASVVVEIAGVAASMGSAIAMSGDTVRIAQNGMIMIHDPWNVAAGTAEDLRKAADMLDKFGTSLVQIYAQKTGIPEDEIRAMMAEETWMDAEEALAKGFVDEIIEPVEATAFADLDVGELAAVPVALTRLIREGRAMSKKSDGTPEPQGSQEPQGGSPSPEAPGSGADVNAAAEAARREERERQRAIRQLGLAHNLGAEWIEVRLEAGDSLEKARASALEELAARSDRTGGPGPVPSGAGVTADEADKLRAGVTAWLITRAGQARTVEAHTGERLDPGEFRGMSLMDLARASVERAGGSTRGVSRMEIAGMALNRTPRAAANGLNTRSDFPVLLENALHKMLQAAYGTTPDTWSIFCARGSVSDFRPHPRLRLGSLSRLDAILESGELRTKHIPDAEKESISASTFGNIVGITRQAIVNDDVDGFSRLVAMLGRAAALSVEIDVYALLGLNAGLGPTMSDTNPLFHDRGAGANNIGTGSVLGVGALDADRVLMASMRDPEGNEILDLRPATLVVPIGLGGEARVINDAQYDVDPVDPGTDEGNKYMKPNKVRGLFGNIVDTPRLTGTRRYLFADPAIAPVIEVVFLDGQESPVLDLEEGFDYDGVRWRVRYDYGVGATDFRGAVTNAGTT
jgi:ATP-dependent Clp endopeptidase proteolytic subunit ClpP